ncbi:carboxypeptidase regulatory-like domain-containing protein [bacterium]|nr:carboxypeptidase regulatory-like domain-containing protein [bacterium]
MGWLLLFVMLATMVLFASCGGGDDDVTTFDGLDEGDDRDGGDESDANPIGVPIGAFTVAGGFGDLRGVAVSQEYVYVADSTTLYAFDKNGNFVNAVAAPATIQAVAVFPPATEMDLPVEEGYFYGGFPVIAHDPIGGVGYLRIYGPNLDTMTTREDISHPDAPKYITLPAGQVIPPLSSGCWAQVNNVYDMDIDRFGSILVTVDLDVVCTDPVPDFPRSLQILNRFNNFEIEYAGPRYCDPIEFPVPEALPCFHRAHGWANGDMGTLGIDTYFPLNRTDVRYTWYTGHFNLLRDFVGVTWVELDPFTDPPSYTTGAPISNSFGYTRVIGETVGNAPGSFNQNPPYNPDGGLEDQDLTNGGPSGMGADPLSDEIFICDPGNRRVQVFAADTGAFVRQIGTGARGRSGSSFLAPSEVAVDLEGNIYVCDVSDLRVIRASYPDRSYGNIGGTVRNQQLNTPLVNATVSLGNELGTLALRGTNINGDYLIQNILVGTYFMNATKFGFDSDTTTVQVLSDETVRVDFNLNPNLPATVGAYTGYIIDADTNLFLGDVTVQIVGTSMETQTDDIGRFQLNSILPGTYQVVFSREDYVTQTRDVEIFAGQTTDDPLIQLAPLPD